jgi:hypothetical protein
MSWRENKSDERGREEHLNDGNITVIAAEYSGKGIGMVNSEAFGGACGRGRKRLAKAKREAGM